VTGDAFEVRRRHARLGLTFGPDTPAARWAGEQLDLGDAVTGLLCANGDLWRNDPSLHAPDAEQMLGALSPPSPAAA
jgi:hypothetical protein